MVNTVYAPDVATYAARSSYITRAEFREAGTGADTSKLLPARSSADEQNAALDRVIARASGWADTFCRKILAATLDTTAGRVRLDARDCALSLPVPYTPVIAVTGVSVGPDALSLTPMTDLSTVWIDGSIIKVRTATWQRWGYMTATYINGWANTVLTAPAAAGATSIVVANPLGLYPGMTLTVDDGGASEQATIATGYVPGSTTVALAGSGLLNDHAVGVSATMLPQAIKEAVILYTAALIRTRGSSSITMASLSSQPETAVSTLPGGSKEQALAEELLMPFRRPV